MPQDKKTTFVADVVDAKTEDTRKLRRAVGKSHCAQKSQTIQRKYKQNNTDFINIPMRLFVFVISISYCCKTLFQVLIFLYETHKLIEVCIKIFVLQL